MVESATGANAETPAARKERVPASVYWSELWTNKRLLLAGVVGIGVGYGFCPYVFSVMGPRLIEAFHWPRSEYASINALMLVMIVVFPFVGRLNDLIGVKKTALIGVVAMPLFYISYALQPGDIKIYAALYLAHGIICITTTAITYTRLIVQYFNKARGFALGIVASGTAIFGAIVSPLLNAYVEAHGWQAGYFLMAAVSGVLGLLALSQLPEPKRDGAVAGVARLSDTKKDYSEIFRNKAFWIMLGAILLCNLPVTVALAQLTLLLLENGVAPANASIMLTAFAAGTLIGRLGSGFALDRFPLHIVCAIGLGLPAIGLGLLASPLDAPPILTFSVLLIGLANGAEGDLMGFVIANKFGTRVYSSVYGMLSGAMSTAAALGSILLGVTLALTNTFILFLTVTAICSALGATLLLLLKNVKPHAEVAASS